jgi:hypothetical protein
MSKDHIYLTTDRNPNGPGLIAIMSQGSLQAGDKEVVVLTLEIVPDLAAAHRWYEQMLAEQPWIERN